MRKLRFAVLFLILLMIPFVAKAESKKINVYIFRGEGCPHCQEAEEWFDSIKGEYGDLFTIVDYETWNNQGNAKLMEAIAKLRGETVEGVPYIIIGSKSWNGFTESYEQEMINEIKSNYSY